MKASIVKLVLIFVLTGLSGHSQDDGEFVSKEGRFSVTFPASTKKVSYRQHIPKDDPYTLKVHFYDLDLNSGRFSIIVGERSRKSSVDSMFAYYQGERTTVSNQTDLTVDGYPARSFDLYLPGTKSYTGKAYYQHYVIVVADLRFYQFAFLTTDRSQLTSSEVLAFFKSFHITK